MFFSCLFSFSSLWGSLEPGHNLMTGNNYLWISWKMSVAERRTIGNLCILRQKDALWHFIKHCNSAERLWLYGLTFLLSMADILLWMAPEYSIVWFYVYRAQHQKSMGSLIYYCRFSGRIGRRRASCYTNTQQWTHSGIDKAMIWYCCDDLKKKKNNPKPKI